MALTPVAELLAAEIRSSGPIPFRRFMDAALYHPEFGYYRRARDPFGRAGDFFTAEQLQPVFGRAMAAYLRGLRDESGALRDFTVVELGAGRGEMGEFLTEFPYVPVEAGRGALPESFSGVVFANEFFDALPVDVAVRRGGEFHEMRVDFDGERFRWRECESVNAAGRDYIERFCGVVDDGVVVEVNLEALRWMEEIARRLTAGFIFAIDYGYVARELVRFPSGTLMSYRRHTASEEVLADPGDRDITAHVNFSALEGHARSCGFAQERFESFALALLRAGEPDNFAAILAAPDEAQGMQRRLQLKTLLFGMGETFRTLLLRRDCTK